MARREAGAWSAAAVLSACATAPMMERAPEREPPLPASVLEVALAPPSEDDGGMRAQYLSMLGREDLVERTTPRTCAPLARNGAAVDPVEEIARRAPGVRVVIVNEDHSRPQHRAFIEAVALRLHQDGFSIYAAETFLPAVQEQHSWPTLSDGFYATEPVFGMLLRRARAAGYTFVAYEDLSGLREGATQQEQIAWREAMQARNIQRILEADPDARLFIHVGFAHLLERPDGRGNIWMAQRLKQATGIDPLTIHQTGYASGETQFTFCDPAQTPSLSVDYLVGSPEVTFENGRPSWRQRAGQRPVAVPPVLLSPTLNTIVEARPAREPDEAVPVDRLLLRPGEMLPLLLAPGRYRVESWTQASGYSPPVAIDVD